MTRALHVKGSVVRVEQKASRSLIADRRLAPILRSIWKMAIRAVFAGHPASQHAALSRALVDEALEWDASMRGAHEASTWGAARLRKIGDSIVPPDRTTAANRLFNDALANRKAIEREGWIA